MILAVIELAIGCAVVKIQILVVGLVDARQFVPHVGKLEDEQIAGLRRHRRQDICLDRLPNPNQDHDRQQRRQQHAQTAEQCAAKRPIPSRRRATGSWTRIGSRGSFERQGGSNRLGNESAAGCSGRAAAPAS